MIDIMDWLTGWDSKASFEEELVLFLNADKEHPVLHYRTSAEL